MRSSTLFISRSPRVRSSLISAMRSLLISTSLLAGATSQVWASPTFDTLGALDSLTSLSAGLSQVPSDAYFNPAGLAWPSARTHVGIVGVEQRLRLTLQPQPRETLISDDIYRARPLNRDVELTALPSDDLSARGLDERAQRQLFMQIGLTQALWAERLYVGMTMLIPLHRFELQAPSFPDERAQYFENTLSFSRWGAELEGMSAAFALAWRLHPSISLGAGASLGNRSVAQSDVFLSDASYQGLSVISPQVEVQSYLSPHASITARHHDEGWGLMGFIGVFGPEEVEVTGDSAVKIWGYPYPDGDDAIVQRFTQRYRVLPLRVRWGGRLNLTSRCSRDTSAHQSSQATCARWSVLTGGQWTQWSSRAEAAERGSDAPSGWVDQWEVSSGLSRETATMGWGADLRWRPTPVPEQSGRSSYVDPSQLALAVSARWSITPSLSWQLSAQAHWLLPRVDEKDLRALDPVRDEFPASVDELSGEPIDSSGGLQSNNPGFPGYESGGVVWSGGVSLTWRDTPDQSP